MGKVKKKKHEEGSIYALICHLHMLLSIFAQAEYACLTSSCRRTMGGIVIAPYEDEDE